MSKYEGIENIGQVMVEELFADIQIESITYDELFKAKLIKKFNETYNLALSECRDELQETLNAINSLRTK